MNKELKDIKELELKLAENLTLITEIDSSVLDLKLELIMLPEKIEEVRRMQSGLFKKLKKLEEQIKG